MPKIWSKDDVLEHMLETVKQVRAQCNQLNQKFTIEDALDQIYTDLDAEGLIEHEP